MSSFSRRPFGSLNDPTEIAPLWRQYPCRTAFPVVSQTIAATPPLLSVKMAYCNPKTGLGRRVSQKKLASEAYRTIGDVARNSIANRACGGTRPFRSSVI